MKKTWKALSFTKHILRKENSNLKSLACTTLVHPILEYGAESWDPYREGQINVLNLQNKVAKFAHHRNDSNWGTLAQCRTIVRICAFFKVYMYLYMLRRL
jgi:hypothetical protein